MNRILRIFGVWWHWQNLNEGEDFKPIGSGFWHGRAWLHFPGTRNLQLSWAFGRHAWFTFIGVDKDCGDGNNLSFKIGVKRLFSLFFTITNTLPFIRANGIEDQNRELEFSIHHGSLWLSLWGDPTGWGPNRTYSFNPVDFLLGWRRCEVIQTGEHYVTIPLDGGIPARIEIKQYVYTRNRWPRKDIHWKANIIPDTPVPIPGKGENSWDLDDDAVYEMSIPFQSVADVIQQFVNDIQKTRLKYGGENWQPEDYS